MTSLSLSGIKESASAEVVEGRSSIGWLPISVLPLIAVAFRNRLPAWVFMWILSFAIFVSLKWLTWWRARARMAHADLALRRLPSGLAGNGCGGFLGCEPACSTAFADELGLGDLGNGSRCDPSLGCGAIPSARSAPSRGWAGMLGLILLLHFGTFQILGLAWQSVGVDARPIMSAPLRSTSLGEFWGKRWNLGFRQLAHELIFRPLHRRLGADLAGFLVFVASGLIHDLVISVPARGGYGLPTIYFLLQGTGMTIEHSRFGKRIGLGQGWQGWCFMMLFLAAPLFWLFHPWFVVRVILPFMQAIHAL